MTHYATQPAKVPALSRTWAATVTYRECGVVTAIRTYTVTLDKRSGVTVAEVDGQPADLEVAVRILRNADTAPVVLSEVVPFPQSMARCLGVSA